MKADIEASGGATPFWLLYVCLAAVLCIAAAGYLHFEARKKDITRDKQNELSAIAHLKANEISMWIKERMADAKSIQDNPFTVEFIAHWLTDAGEAGESLAKIHAWLDSIKGNYSYNAVLLLDGAGVVKAAAPRDAVIGSGILPGLEEAARARSPILLDFHRNDAVSGVHIDFVVPFCDPSVPADAPPAGYAVLRSDPHEFLYPLVRSWPTPSDSAESLLVRKEGDEVLYLNELRHRSDGALSLRFPANSPELTAALAVRGFRGVTEGIDYRGVPVLAAVVGIPDSSWILIAKVDTEEIYAPVRQRAQFVTIVVCLLILASGAIATSVWRHQRSRFYRKQYEIELEKQKLAQQYEFLSKYANDIILVVDENGGIEDANERAVNTYGYEREELVGLDIRQLRTPETVSDIASQMQEIHRRSGLIFETVHRRKDGSVFPVEVSSRRIQFGDRSVYQSIIRDISDRKQAEATILHSNRLYAVLSQVNQAIVRIRDRDELFREICRIAVVYGRFRMSWIGIADHDTGVIRPIAHEGAGKSLVSQWTIPLFDEPESYGPTGRAAREGGYSFCNDIRNDPRMVPWSATLTDMGVHSCASIPILLNGWVVGTLSVYAAERDFFDEVEKELLLEIGMDISFGLEKIGDDLRREQSDAAVRASEERFRAIFREAAISVFLMEPAGRLLAVNRAMHSCFGYTEDESLSMHYGQYVHPEDAPTCMEQFQILSSGFLDATPPEVRRYVRKSGQFLWGRLVASAIRGARGDLQLIVGMIEDITVQKEAHETIVRARDFYLTLFDQSPTLIWRAGADAKCDYFNATWLSFTGRSLEVELGYGWSQSVHPDDFENYITAYLEAFRAHRQFEIEYRLRRHDGVYRWIVAIGRPFCDLDGNFAGYVGSCYDFTDRKLAEERLAESERRLRKMLENAQLIALSLDRNGVVTFCNDYFLQVTGWTRAETIALGWYDEGFVPPEEREARKSVFQTRMDTGTMPSHYESDILTRAGRRRTISWNVTTLTDDAGRTIGTTSIGEDVTDRRDLETQLRQAQKMEAIGTLAGGIAHDFNNILAAILGYTEIALYKVPEGDSVRGSLQQVLKASSRAKELIGQILAFSRQSEQAKRPVRLSLVLGEALKLLRASLPSTIDIQHDFAKGEDSILADPTQMHQVVMNLCTNAAHAMQEKGGRLDVNLGDAHLDEAFVSSNPDLKPGTYLRLSVVDTGCGMDRATLERIFDPFFTTKATGSGTGMGLAVVHGIVKSHGGAIIVHSEPGRGSTFDVYFPKLESGALPEAEKTSELKRGEGRILFVDDEEALVGLSVKILRMLGYDVVARTSSVEALEIFRRQPERFDLVVTDYTMPQMTGIDMAEELVRIKPGIPVILCTGYSEKLSEETVKAKGVSALLLKPLSVGQLSEAVAAAMESRPRH